MKRSSFKQKPRKPLKRTPLKAKNVPLKRSKLRSKSSKLKKRSPQKISTIQRKIWALLKEKLRKKYGNTCYTCGATDLQGSNWHMGHMWAKASLGAYLKYDERVLRPQCYYCNINCGGQGADFYKKMKEEIGTAKMRKLEADRNVQVKAYDHYTQLLEELQKTP